MITHLEGNNKLLRQQLRGSFSERRRSTIELHTQTQDFCGKVMTIITLFCLQFSIVEKITTYSSNSYWLLLSTDKRMRTIQY
jgi:hypothetical protein